VLYTADDRPPLRLPVVKPVVPMAVPAGDAVVPPVNDAGHGADVEVAFPRNAAVCGMLSTFLKITGTPAVSDTTCDFVDVVPKK